MRRILKFFLLLFLLALLVVCLKIYSNLKDRTPDYKADMKIAGGVPGQLLTGFAAVAVTPDVPDRWNDVNNDAAFDPDDGDTYTDGNGNGSFDPVWIAGFGNRRAANGIHDDLWARTMVIDDGRTRLAIVALDAIGFMNDDVVDVRSKIPADAGITYLIITSTHTHEGPDLLGLWGESYLRSGVNEEYLQKVKQGIIRSVTEAATSLRPSVIEVSEDLSGALPLVKDTRKPEVFDPGIRIIRSVDKVSGKTLGTLVSWGNHPETLWGKNLLVTSDFPNFVRHYIENGIMQGDSVLKQGAGGITVYVSSSVGGLMTTHPSISVKDPLTGKEYSEASFEKADAEGKQLALFALGAMDRPSERIDSASISLVSRSVILPIKNRFFRLGTIFGILDRGTVGWMNMRSELAVINIGPISITTFPGEVYPEIINGGIESPAGNDFDILPQEVPPVRDMMAGKYKFIFGLANDEIGYIVPKSQWDEKEPFTYDNNDAPYGEENSLGPETAGLLHRNISEMLQELNPDNR